MGKVIKPVDFARFHGLILTQSVKPFYFLTKIKFVFRNTIKDGVSNSTSPFRENDYADSFTLRLADLAWAGKQYLTKCTFTPIIRGINFFFSVVYNKFGTLVYNYYTL